MSAFARSALTCASFSIALSLFALAIEGCCDARHLSNKAAWASEDRGVAVVDVNRRLPNGQQDYGVVRSGPGFQFGKVTSLPSGTQVTVLENQKSDVGWWSHIRFHTNQEGWMHQDILLKAREMTGSGRDFTVAGTYKSVDDNTCSIVDAGSDAIGSCTNNLKLTCNKANYALSCQWFGGNNIGMAHLVQARDGSLVGSWGHGHADSGGGAWTLTPL